MGFEDLEGGLVSHPAPDLTQLFLVRFGSVSLRHDELTLPPGLGGFLVNLRRGQVLHVLTYERRPESALGKGEHFQREPQFAPFHLQDIAFLEIATRLDGAAAEAHIVFGTGLGGQTAGLEDADMVQIKISSHGTGKGRKR